jgi:hypothetical protein
LKVVAVVAPAALAAALVVMAVEVATSSFSPLLRGPTLLWLELLERPERELTGTAEPEGHQLLQATLPTEEAVAGAVAMALSLPPEGLMVVVLEAAVLRLPASHHGGLRALEVKATVAVAVAVAVAVSAMVETRREART